MRDWKAAAQKGTHGLGVLGGGCGSRGWKGAETGEAQRWGAEARRVQGSAWGAGVGVGDEGERWLELETQVWGWGGGLQRG